MPFSSQIQVLGKEACQRVALLPSLPLPLHFKATFPVLYQPCTMSFYSRTFARIDHSAYLILPLTSCFLALRLYSDVLREHSVQTHPFHSGLNQVSCVLFLPAYSCDAGILRVWLPTPSRQNPA